MEDKIIQLYVEGLSISKIMNLLGVSQRRVNKVLQHHNISIRYSGREHFGPRESTKLRNILITPEIENIINGLLLGDGSISKDATLILGSTSKQYVEFTATQLNDAGIKTKIYSQTHKKSWGVAPIWYLRTFSIPLLLDFYDKWYVEGKKRKIPPDLKLTPDTLLHMYVGDGSLNKKSRFIQISTHCFELKSLNLLKDKLKSITIESSILAAGKMGYILNIYGTNCEKFLSYIGNCPVEDYSYKWNLHKYLTSRKQWYVGKDLANKIREEYLMTACSQIYLARRYNFSASTICNIVNDRVHKQEIM